jgi:serine protease Do
MTSIAKCALVAVVLGAVTLAPAWAQFERSGAYLGVEMEDVTSANMSKHHLSSERGVIVKSVAKGSPAQAAGVREADVILEYSGIPVLSAAQLVRMVHETPVGRKVDLTVSRAGNKHTLTATVGKRDSPLSAGPEAWPDLRSFGYRRPDGIFRFQVPDGRGFGFSVPDLARPAPPPGPPAAGRMRLGVTLQPLTDQMRAFLGAPADKGVLVTSVAEGSAASGKLQAGDVIVKAGAEEISEMSELQRVIGRSSGKVELTIIRNKTELAVAVEIAAEAGSFRL